MGAGGEALSWRFLRTSLGCERGFGAHDQGLWLSMANIQRPCACCSANCDDVPWTDGRPAAQWLTRVWGNDDWIAAHPDRHQLFKLPGVGITPFIPDVMHVLRLGCYQYVFGSVLKYLTHHAMGGNVADNLKRVWEQIQASYKAPHSTHKPMLVVKGSK